MVKVTHEKMSGGIRKMVQRLKTLAALPENLGCLPTPTRQLPTGCNFSSKSYDYLFLASTGTRPVQGVQHTLREKMMNIKQ